MVALQLTLTLLVLLLIVGGLLWKYWIEPAGRSLRQEAERLRQVEEADRRSQEDAAATRKAAEEELSGHTKPDQKEKGTDESLLR